MNLGLKTALIVGSASVILAMMLSLVFSGTWRSEFDQLERKHVEDHFAVIESSLKAQTEQLFILNYDWSA